MTGGEALAGALTAAGVEHLFAVPGTSGMGLTDAVMQSGKPAYVLALHEVCAVSMADGYARATGRPGVAYVNVFPGTANSIGSLYNAYRDNSPLVVLSAQQDTRISGRDAHTESSDMVEVTRQVTKWSWEAPRADRLVEAVARALKVATSPPAGPVFLSISSNLLNEKIEAEVPPFERYRVDPRLGADDDAIARVATILLNAKMPLIVAGAGVTRAGACDLLVQLAELIAAPVVAEPRYSSLAFPSAHPLFFPLPDRVEQLQAPRLGRPDVTFVIGGRLVREYRYQATPAVAPRSVCIQINEDAWEIAKIYPADVGLVADARSALVALLRQLRAQTSAAHRRLIAARRDLLQEAAAARDRALDEEARRQADAIPIRPWRLARELRAALGDDAIIVNESPTSKRFLMNHYTFTRPENYLANSAAGCLGWGLPAALGVKLARPDRPVVACLGDGSLMFAIQALWTAANYHIPILIVVFNNRGYMAVKNQFRVRGVLSEEQAGLVADFGPRGVDFARLGETFGIMAERVEDPSAIRPALEKALAHGGPALLDVLIEQSIDS